MRHLCKCGSRECNPFGCRFEPREPKFTDQFRWKKPYQPANQTDISRWLDEQLVADIERHCGKCK